MKIRESINPANIPQNDSIQELVCFWDAHDLTDFEDELEEVTETVFERDASGRSGTALEP